MLEISRCTGTVLLSILTTKLLLFITMGKSESVMDSFIAPLRSLLRSLFSVMAMTELLPTGQSGTNQTAFSKDLLKKESFSMALMVLSEPRKGSEGFPMIRMALGVEGSANANVDAALEVY